MPKPKKFVLNDESVQNSYGFYILTAGIKLDRFNDNPVMLSDHINKNENVIGKWLNLEVKGGKIQAEPEFDVARPQAAEISGQVERDFLKGASMGILPNWDSIERIGDRLILKECELVEASIVPVPSNRNSIAIYSIDGKLLNESEIKTLCLSAVPGENNPESNLNIHNMKKIILSVGALVALGFKDQPTDGLDVSAVEAKILDLSSQVQTLTQKNQALELAAKTAKEAQEAATKTRIESKVALAITKGQFKADQKEEMINLGLTSEAALDTVIGSIPEKQNFSAGVIPGTGNPSTEIKTMDDFEKLSVENKLLFKENNPED